jgi:uncharacterized Tic20 family protein
MTLENCPNCANKLGAALPSSGRQVCMKCGWSDRPKESHYHPHHSDTLTNHGYGARSVTDSVLALSILCHASVFLTPILVFPIVVPLVLFLGCSDSIVKENAREALNFQIYSIIIGILIAIAAVFAFILIPIILPIALAFLVLSIVLPIVVIIQIWQSPSEIPNYPFIQRFI